MVESDRTYYAVCVLEEDKGSGVRGVVMFT